MNTIQNTTIALDSAEQVELDKWCAEVHAIFVEHSRPIEEPDDPRLGDLGDLSAFNGDVTAEQLGKLYAAFNAPGYPAIPIKTPDWVERVEVKVNVYPEITVFFWGKNWGDESMSVQIAQIANIETTEVEAEGQVNRHVIELLDPPRLEVDVPEELTADDALELATALVAAARQLEAARR